MKLPKELDLTENQEKIYLEYLSSGEDTAANIARKIGIDKTTAYRAVEELVKRRLLIRHPRQRGTTYTAANPEILKETMEDKLLDLESKSKKLEKIISNLIRKSKNKEETFISVEKGVYAHYKMMQRQLNAKDKLVRQKLNVNAPIYDFTSYPGTKNYMDFVKEYIEQRKKKGIHVRQLVHANIQMKLQEIHKTSKEQLKEVRILPIEIMPNSSFKVFDDYFIISIHKEKVDDLTILTVKDPIVAELIKTLFDFIFTRSIIYYGEKNTLQTKSIGNTSVPTIGMGTWGVGGFKTRNPYNDDLNDVEQLKHSLSLGQKYIDTCLTYAEGYSVDLVARAIKNYPREELFINGKFTYNPDFTLPLEARDIEKQCNIYLKKLNTDYLDSFMIHDYKHTLRIGIENVMQAMDKLKKKGKIKNISVSNFTVQQLKEAMKYTTNKIVANELHYNHMVRVIEDLGIYSFCEENNISIIAYRPIRQGQFNEFEDETLINRLAQKYNKTPLQIALNWLISRPNVLAIPKSTNGSHINENVAAAGWIMSKEDYKKMDEWKYPDYKIPKNFDPEFKLPNDKRTGWTGL